MMMIGVIMLLNKSEFQCLVFPSIFRQRCKSSNLVQYLRILCSIFDLGLLSEFIKYKFYESIVTFFSKSLLYRCVCIYLTILH